MEVRVKRIAKPDSNLVHSDSFLGMEFSDELYHWKYIKREKKNGKWVYTYDKESLKADVKKVTGYAAKEDMQKAEKALAENSKKLSETADSLRVAKMYTSQAKTDYKILSSMEKSAAAKVTEAGFDYGIAKAAYLDKEAELRKIDGGKLSIKRAKADREYKEALDAAVEASNKVKAAQETHDRYKDQVEAAKERVDELKEQEFVLSEKEVAQKRELLNTKKDYAESKSAYDRSLAGLIDRGKELFEQILDDIDDALPKINLNVSFDTARVINDISRTVDGATYDVRDSILSKKQSNATTLEEYSVATMERGANEVSRILNDVNDGRLDNELKRYTNELKKRKK